MLSVDQLCQCLQLLEAAQSCVSPYSNEWDVHSNQISSLYWRHLGLGVLVLVPLEACSYFNVLLCLTVELTVLHFIIPQHLTTLSRAKDTRCCHLWHSIHILLWELVTAGSPPSSRAVWRVGTITRQSPHFFLHLSSSSQNCKQFHCLLTKITNGIFFFAFLTNEGLRASRNSAQWMLKSAVVYLLYATDVFYLLMKSP